VRADCQSRFGADAVVDTYERLYFEMTAAVKGVSCAGS